jgi:hypothetical protein
MTLAYFFKTPFCSRPTTANLRGNDVSDLNANPASVADHSMVAPRTYTGKLRICSTTT